MNLAELRTHTPILNKKKEKKARKPIKKVAKKRAKLNREYMKLRAEFLAAHPYCQYYMAEHKIDEDQAIARGGRFDARSQFMIPASTEIHHKKGRGKYLNDTSTWMAVCTQAHQEIHFNTAESYRMGWMLPRR